MDTNMTNISKRRDHDNVDGKKTIKNIKEQNGKELHLKRELGLVSGVSLVVGSMIGSGIFISPKGIFENTESVGMSLVIWVLCGLISMCGALCYAELGTMIPKSGGEYSYFLDTYGGMVAFMFSWVSNFILKPALAVVILACAEYIVQPFYEGTSCGAPDIVVKLIAICITVFLTAVNCYSVRLSTFITNFFTFAKLIALAIIIVVGFIEIFKGNTQYLKPKTSFIGSSSSVSAYALAFYQGLWAYEGWNNLYNVTEELTSFKRNLPLSIIIGIPLVTVVYVLTNIAYFAVLSPEELLLSDGVAFTFAQKTLGTFAWIVQVAVVFSVFGASNANLLPSCRVGYAAAREGHMPNIMSMVHVSRITPVPAVLFLGSMTIILMIPGSIDSLINYFSFAAWLIYGLAFIAVLVLRYKHPEWDRPIKVPLFLPVLMIIASCYLVIAPILEDPALEFLYAFLFIVSGLLLYFPLVKFQLIQPRFFDKITAFLQKLLLVVPSGYNTE
ncbi:b(0,+)-type amino acid transporter 1-like [Amphiura filiformis]|uniref:b(0,+)-type amino acid transporter 1-like n=1 Tax=Amphiura filiformis TaxID=82378 RepID=UPI003B21BB52